MGVDCISRITPNVVVLSYRATQTFFVEGEGGFVPLTEKRLAKFIPGFQDMRLEARERHFQRWLKDEVEISLHAEIKSQLPNTKRRIQSHGKEHKPAQEDFRVGVQTFLRGTELFEDKAAGVQLIADILCGQHATAFRQAAPSFRPVTSISSDRPEIRDLLEAITRAAVPRKKWKGRHYHVKRKAVLDFTNSGSLIPPHIQDFSQVKIKAKHIKGIHQPFPYEDTLALVIGANAVQIREAAPYLENAAVIFLSSDSGDFKPTKLPLSSVLAYDPEIVARFETETQRIAAVLRWWWELFEDEDAWASRIVQDAKASFGKQDSRYIRVEFDPQKLRAAIRYQVFLSFLDEVEAAGFMTADELVSYRQGAKEVFDPAPPEVIPPRRAEDPEVFLEIMRKLAESEKIVPENSRYVKSEKALGAWRTISGERHLVMLESTWAKAYAKAIRAEKSIDASIFQQPKWTLTIQQALCEDQIIKVPSSGYRYRYDLLSSGARDQTYVVAIPAHLLTD